MLLQAIANGRQLSKIGSENDDLVLTVSLLQQIIECGDKHADLVTVDLAGPILTLVALAQLAVAILGLVVLDEDDATLETNGHRARGVAQRLAVLQIWVREVAHNVRDQRVHAVLL